MGLDLEALTSSWTVGRNRAPLFLLLFLLVRVRRRCSCHRGILPGRSRAALAILQCTALPGWW